MASCEAFPPGQTSLHHIWPPSNSLYVLENVKLQQKFCKSRQKIMKSNQGEEKKHRRIENEAIPSERSSEEDDINLNGVFELKIIPLIPSLRGDLPAVLLVDFIGVNFLNEVQNAINFSPVSVTFDQV